MHINTYPLVENEALLYFSRSLRAVHSCDTPFQYVWASAVYFSITGRRLAHKIHNEAAILPLVIRSHGHAHTRFWFFSFFFSF